LALTLIYKPNTSK